MQPAIRRTHAASYKNDAKGVALNYEVADQIISCMRNVACSEKELDVKIPQFLKTIKGHLEQDEMVTRRSVE